MSEADSISPRPRRGMKGSSDGSEPFCAAAGRRTGSRSVSRSQESSAELSRISRCSGVAHCTRISLIAGRAASSGWPSFERSISAATFSSSR